MPQTKITIKSDGSIKVEGDFAIADPEGKEFGLGGRTAISLCRCGHSQDKPFCDGSHRQVGFRYEVHARDLPPPVPKPAPAG
jgi:CDGSH-type Zn-finger protein